MSMQSNQIRSVLNVALASVLFASAPVDAFSKEPSTALELARQLNQAFIEVADAVSPAVVVIRVAHKADFSESNSDSEGEIPFWDLIPRQFRRQLEQQQREKQRHE